MANFTRDQELKMRWDMLIEFLSDRFSDGADVDVEGSFILSDFKSTESLMSVLKEDNVNLIHIGLCTILEPFGHYLFDFYDEQGWPHFELVEPLPNLKPGEQSILVKTAIVDYFVRQGVIS